MLNTLQRQNTGHINSHPHITREATEITKQPHYLNCEDGCRLSTACFKLMMMMMMEGRKEILTSSVTLLSNMGLIKHFSVPLLRTIWSQEHFSSPLFINLVSHHIFSPTIWSLPTGLHPTSLFIQSL